ncbi:chitosanase [Streptomyces sp. NPDC057136]|uniref:chitosanase n=1 Tax=Streptomyces sp. NPDC057136 TaxID=3346029 RepID=UPI003641BCEF
MLAVVERYAAARPGNPLAPYLPALRAVKGSDAHTGLGRPFTEAWAKAASDPAFRSAQDAERDHSYFDPAVERAKSDGLSALGQFIYYDAYVMHGHGDTDSAALAGVRRELPRRRPLNPLLGQVDRGQNLNYRGQQGNWVMGDLWGGRTGVWIHVAHLDADPLHGEQPPAVAGSGPAPRLRSGAGPSHSRTDYLFIFGAGVYRMLPTLIVKLPNR